MNTPTSVTNDMEIRRESHRPLYSVIAVILLVGLAVGCGLLFMQNMRLRNRITNYTDYYDPEYLLFNSITVTRFREMVASGDDFIVSISRPTCSDCSAFSPVLMQEAERLGMTEDIYYLNVGGVRRNSTDEEWAAFKESIGFMYTPTLARYADGVQVAMIDSSETPLTATTAGSWLQAQKE